MFLRKNTGPVSWIVVFLGNPGAKYAGTRHNVGFMTADEIGRTAGVKIDRLRFKALTGAGTLGGEKVFLMKPQTYMNLSGDAVQEAVRFYKLPIDRVIAVSDDAALPAGKIRIRRNGSAGGHNGLKDIIAKCGGDNFPRVKIGVGQPPHADYDMADWVLGAFAGKDKELIADAVKTAAAAVETIVAQGIDKAMNMYN
ncbi:peptidyl-tRNA hydrolase, PTH1 family [Sporobacter termitidis DSM 10068]|uniref:Peptidyl-tRNA hydrolase n=1 Tax=Sporobacter termitidis DSM 10068 TaxID=1123282 RepID=A0A1M5VF28_9FIRM|nr:aminoacyl-tRNA hydrolase [Sporobacter termitidis]SHH73714.1 peptidyl-tRNA hydrolase, PTH1 family [Sporobacter termitidis DSM 10068]